MKKILKKYWWIILLFLLGGVLAVKTKVWTVFNTLVGKSAGGIKKYCPVNKIDPDFLEKANKIRIKFLEEHKINLADRLTSAYRCPQYNRIVGGTPDSSHIKGLAMDVKMSKDEAEKFIKIAARFGVKRFLFKSKDGPHLHFDVDPSKPAVTRWA